MTYAPARLKELAAYWTAQGGKNLGIVGDTDHQTGGVSYHLGRDQLIPGAYSARRPRDIAGLTNAASAIDLGRLNGSYPQLRAFSDWLARRCVANDPKTVDVVEVIYSPDGKRVLGFKEGVDFLIPDYGDLSHLTHTHISFFRDSEFRDKTALFAPYFTEVEMPGLALSMIESYAGTATVVGSGHSYIRVHDGLVYPVAAGWEKRVFARARLAAAFTTPSGGVIASGTPVVVIGDTQAVLLEQEVTLVADPASDTQHRVAIAVDGTIQLGSEVTV